MDSFPVAEVTNCHTLGCLKQQRFFSLILLEAKSPKLRCQQGHTSCESFRGYSVPRLFQVLVAPSIPLACGWVTLTCLHFHFASSSFIYIKSPKSLLQRCLSLKLGHTYKIQNNLFISRHLMATANTLFPNNRHSFWELGHEQIIFGILFNLQQKITNYQNKSSMCMGQ